MPRGRWPFSGNQGNAAVSYDGANFNTVFLGYPFEAIPALADRSAVMGTAVDFFGGCEAPPAVSLTPADQSKTGEPGMLVSYVFTVTNEATVEQDSHCLSVDALWPTVVPRFNWLAGAGCFHHRTGGCNHPELSLT